MKVSINKMDEHPPSQTLRQYCRRTLSPDVFLVVQKHVNSCTVCAHRNNLSAHQLEDYDILWSALIPSPTSESYHLSSAELSSFVKDDLGVIDRENAESHMELCDQCKGQMQEVREAMKMSLADVEAQASSKSTPGFWEGVRAYAVGAFQRRTVQLTALAIVIAAFIIVASFLIRTPIDHTARQTPPQNVNNAVNQTQPAILPQKSEGAEKMSNEVAPSNESQWPLKSPKIKNPTNSSGTLVLQINDGGQQLVLDQRGALKGAEHLPFPLQQAVRTTLVSQKLERPLILSELHEEASTLLSESTNGLPFQLVGPVRKVMINAQPTFRWQPLAGATSYIVMVTDAQLNQVATSDPLTVREWKIPKKLQGGVYSWQVTAIRDGRRVTSPVLPAPQAKFKVVEQDKVEELERARQTYPDSHLALGLLYTEAGLLDESIREFSLLLKANPHSSLARKLLAQVQAMQRGQ